MNCNTALGHFKDNPTLLRNAAEYLIRNEEMNIKQSEKNIAELRKVRGA